MYFLFSYYMLVSLSCNYLLEISSLQVTFLVCSELFTEVIRSRKSPKKTRRACSTHFSDPLYVHECTEQFVLSQRDRCCTIVTKIRIKRARLSSAFDDRPLAALRIHA